VLPIAPGLQPCSAAYGSGKNARFDVVHDGADIRFIDGRHFVVPKGGSLELFDDVAPAGIPTPEMTRDVKSRVERLKGGGDAEIHCFAAAEPAYVQGCVTDDPSVLAPCPGDDAVNLVPGNSPRRLLAAEAGAGAAWLGLALFAALLGLARLWLALAFRRPIVAELAQHARQTARSEEPRDLIGYIFVGTTCLAAIAFMAVFGGSGWYVLTMFVVLLGAVAVWFLVGVRYRRLSSALSIVRGLGTSKLAEARGHIHELAVCVSEDAPRVAPLSGSSRPAFVRVTVSEVVLVSGSKSDVELTMERAEISYPRWLPIDDGSASAFIDMKPCQLDAPPREPIVAKGALELPAWVNEQLNGPLVPAKRHEKWKIAWMTLEPGDKLLVYGTVERLESGAEMPDGPKLETGYRTAPVALGIRERAVAYAGDERELERALRKERLAVLPIAACLAAAIVATVVGCIHALSLV
jgi:hypothetical protein